MIYIWVGIAGFFGASLRYSVGLLLFDADVIFPFSTLSVNLLGSFFLAWFTYKLVHKYSISTKWKTALGTGFIGSFTTFSTLSVETVMLFEKGSLTLAILYIFLSVSGGLLLSKIGFSLGERR